MFYFHIQPHKKPAICYVVLPEHKTILTKLHTFFYLFLFPFSKTYEIDFTEDVADKFIKSHDDLKIPVGWSCYEWLLGFLMKMPFYCYEDKFKSL
ncbi:MAG: hypothetical protein ACOWWR_13480 [Eubacteriales bacterium]